MPAVRNFSAAAAAAIALDFLLQVIVIVISVYCPEAVYSPVHE
jgi:hypothetical protein